MRPADMLRHTYLQEARFGEAVGHFESALEEARRANAPLCVGGH
ncbi:hypothetical protein [Actinomadura verrucosospora]